MFSAYVDIGVTASSSRSSSSAPRIVSAPQTSGSSAATTLPEDHQREQEEHRERDLLGVRQVLLHLALTCEVAIAAPPDRASRHGRDARRTRSAAVRQRAATRRPARRRRRSPHGGRCEERRRVLREHRLRLDERSTRASRAGVGGATSTSTCGDAESRDARSTDRLGAQALAALRDELVRGAAEHVRRPRPDHTRSDRDDRDHGEQRPRPAQGELREDFHGTILDQLPSQESAGGCLLTDRRILPEPTRGGAMTEPREIADMIERVTEGVWHWRIHNGNIGGAISSSHAVVADGGCVLIDPVRLSADALAALPAPTAILLNAKTHQRSSWRYRRELGIRLRSPPTHPPPTRSPTGATPRTRSFPAGCARSARPGRSGRTTPFSSSAIPASSSAPT